jgi:hypothetical protein
MIVLIRVFFKPVYNFFKKGHTADPNYYFLSFSSTCVICDSPSDCFDNAMALST